MLCLVYYWVSVEPRLGNSLVLQMDIMRNSLGTYWVHLGVCRMVVWLQSLVQTQEEQQDKMVYCMDDT